MKKFSTFLFLSFALLTNAFSQNLTQADFTGVIVPQYTASGTATRLPTAYRATVNNLTANATYRYVNQAAISTDLGAANAGAGNPMFIEGSTFTYTTTTGFVTAGQYGQFTTNASGSYTGWFCFVNTGNTRFTAGNTVYPSLSLNDGASGTMIVKRLALDQTMTVLAFATTSGASDGTGIRGTSQGTAKDIVGLFDNTAVSGRPLSMTYIESEGTAVASVVPFYSTSVDGVAGAWGSIIPNVNANGVKAIRRYALSDATVRATSTDADGTWPSGTITVNPTGGTTAIVISTTDAALPIELTYFDAKNGGNSTKISWQTASEKNNAHFNIQRSRDGQNFTRIGQVKSIGNSQTAQNYQFTDDSNLQGVNYYRLEQVDFDGTTALSAVKSVFVGKSGQWVLANTVTNNVLTLSNSRDTEGPVLATISDATGRLVQQINVGTTHSATIDVTQLTTGHYFVRIGNETLRFFKN